MMTPRQYVAFNHIRDFIEREAPVMHVGLTRSLETIREALDNPQGSAERAEAALEEALTKRAEKEAKQ